MGIFHRVRTFTKYFKPEVKETTKEVLESGLTADLTEAASNYQTDLETIAAQIQEKEENIKKTEQSLEAMEKDSEDYTRTKAVYTELQNERKTFIRYRDNDLAVIYREEAVSAFHDALCNLTLFVETLARGRSNLIVAFGNLHVQLLKSLLEKVDKQHKDYELYEPPK